MSACNDLLASKDQQCQHVNVAVVSKTNRPESSVRSGARGISELADVGACLRFGSHACVRDLADELQGGLHLCRFIHNDCQLYRDC